MSVAAVDQAVIEGALNLPYRDFEDAVQMAAALYNGAEYLVTRRIPATIPLERRQDTKTSQYHLTDPYLRFYFRFIAPNAELVEQELSTVLWKRISDQFRAFVGMTAFKDLCREWVLAKARAGKLPLIPEVVGSHWSANVQVDMVAVN